MHTYQYDRPSHSVFEFLFTNASSVVGVFIHLKILFVLVNKNTNNISVIIGKITLKAPGDRISEGLRKLMPHDYF